MSDHLLSDLLPMFSFMGWPPNSSIKREGGKLLPIHFLQIMHNHIYLSQVQPFLPFCPKYCYLSTLGSCSIPLIIWAARFWSVSNFTTSFLRCGDHYWPDLYISITILTDLFSIPLLMIYDLPSFTAAAHWANLFIELAIIWAHSPFWPVPANSHPINVHVQLGYFCPSVHHFIHTLNHPFTQFGEKPLELCTIATTSRSGNGEFKNQPINNTH